MLLKLFEKKQETDDVISFKFKSDEKLSWKAGQYLFYTLPNDNPDNRGVTRYFTISSSPFENFITITTRISNPSSSFKKSLVNMNIGDSIEASGPDGSFVIDSDLIGVENSNKNYVFIAGGIGITPFRSILLDLDNKKLPINVQLLYANSTGNIVFKDELELLAGKNPNFKINYIISPNHIDEKILSLIVNRQSSIVNPLSFYISGPSQFVRSIRELLIKEGASPENIKLDSFPGYK